MVLSYDQRLQIVTLSEAGHSCRQLANQFGIRPNTVSDLLRKYRETGSVENRQGQGRRRISSQRQDRALLRLSANDPRASSRALRQQWATLSGVEASASTVRSRLFQGGRFSYIARKKPLLTARHKARRLQWCQQHANWTQDDWSRVLYTDETPLHLVQTSQRRYYRSRRGAGHVQIVQPRVQGGGGSCMVWSGFSSLGVLPLHQFHGNVTAQSYIAALDEHVQPFFAANPAFQLQQDNARPHTARVTRQWFTQHNVQTMEWPPCSPDLNPIENCWGHLKSELDKRHIHGMNQLFETASDIWNAITNEFLQNLIASMPQRCQQVIQRRGGISDY